MGIVLATFTYAKSPTFAIPRQQIVYLAVDWASQFVVSCGETTILQETIFGGYQAHIRLHDWIWNYSSKTAILNNLFDTFYVTAPGTTTPISAGICNLDWHIDINQKGVPVITLVMQGAVDRHWSYIPLPPSASAWQQPYRSSWPNCFSVIYP